MDLRFIVDGLEDSGRIEDEQSKRPSPDKVPRKSLDSQKEAFPAVGTGSPVFLSHLVSSHGNMESTSIDAPTDMYVPLGESIAQQSVELNYTHSIYPPNKHYHYKHLNPSAIVPSARKNSRSVQPPVGLIRAAQHQYREETSLATTSTANYRQYPGGNGISDNLTYSSNLMSYPSSPPLSGNLPGCQFYKIASHPYEILDGKSHAELFSSLTLPTTHYLPAIVPHTSPPHKHSIKQETSFSQLQAPGIMNKYTSIIQGIQHSPPTMLNSANNTPRSRSFFDPSNKPSVPANTVNDHILLIDADTDAVLFDQHSITTSNNIKYGCRRCGRAFPRKCDTVRHVQMHLGIRPNICGVCGKRFIQRSALTIHLRVHTGEKPFDCSQCGRAFNDPSSLIKHRYTHQRNARIKDERKRDLQKQASFSKHRMN